jgi:hypothetical protein
MNLAIAYKLLLASILSYGVHSTDHGPDKLKLDPILMPNENIKLEYVRESSIKPRTIWFCQSQVQGQIDAFMYAETTNEIFIAFRGTSLPAKFEISVQDLWPTSIFKSTAPFDLKKLFHQLSFSMTDSLRVIYDWNNNFRAKAIIDSEFHLKGKIHEGFYNSIKNLWNEPTCNKNLKSLVNDLKEAKLKGKKIYFTGHSKGGALAHLAAAMISQVDSKAKPNAIYSFGSPRFGNSDFLKFYSRQYKHNSWRFEYRDDIIPHLPLSSPMIEEKTSELLSKFNIEVFKNLGLEDYYVSVGELVYIDDILKPYRSSKDKLAEERLKRMQDTIRGGQLLNFIFDHTPLWGTSYHGFLLRYKK